MVLSRREVRRQVAITEQLLELAQGALMLDLTRELTCQWLVCSRASTKGMEHNFHWCGTARRCRARSTDGGCAKPQQSRSVLKPHSPTSALQTAHDASVAHVDRVSVFNFRSDRRRYAAVSMVLRFLSGQGLLVQYISTAADDGGRIMHYSTCGTDRHFRFKSS